MNPTQAILKLYFKEKGLVLHNIASFDHFIEKEMQEIVNMNKGFIPDIIPKFLDGLEIKFGSIWVEAPRFKEADGSVNQKITPSEARIRDLTYESPVFLEVIKIENGVEKEKENIFIGNIPIMVRSKLCVLNSMNEDELINIGEDPGDMGGYFIINGTERVIVIVEDLSQNKLFVNETKTGIYPWVGKIFSEDNQYRIPHTFEKAKDGVICVSFTRIDKIPFVLLMKALGVKKDVDIIEAVGKDEKFMSDLYINLYETAGIKTQEDALDDIGKRLRIIQSKERRVERVKQILDRFLLPHIGHSEKERIEKANFLAKCVKKMLLVSQKRIVVDDKDHYVNKRLRLPGDMMKSLFSFVFNMLVSDMKYNFERLVKRGKYPSVQAVCRDQLLTSRVRSALATGEWVGGKHGVSQHLQRNNFYDTMSHLRRVVSSLTAVRENFEARDLHPTHWGRLCTAETPEGQSIGLRKNLAIMCEISTKVPEKREELIASLKEFGMKEFED